MSEISSSNKRATKNAVALILRAIFAMVVGLITSRIVLRTLGVSDFGVYGVVGSIVTLFSFLNAAMSGAASRFLSYEMGRGDMDEVKQMFAAIVNAHLIISGIVVVLAETIGLWFLNNKLNIPAESMYAAQWVFQLSIITAVLNILQVPYYSAIIANEKMTAYAYIRIYDVVLKLLLVLLLVILPGNKLIWYAVLMCIVGLVMRVIMWGYCYKKFPECKSVKLRDRSKMKLLLSFALFDLYGTFSGAACTQGRTFLINIFFGVIYNTAVSLGVTVYGMVNTLTSTISMAFRPQIIKFYAQKQFKKMQSSLTTAIKFTIIAYTLLAVPLAIEAHYVLELWLGEIPPHAEMFVQIVVLTSVLNLNITIMNIPIHATGNIKRLSFINGSLYLINPGLVWVVFKLGYPAWSAYVVNFFVLLTILLLIFYYVKLQIPDLNPRALLLSNALTYFLALISAIPLIFIAQYVSVSFIRVLLNVFVYIFTFGSLSLLFLLTKENRQFIIEKIKGLKKKFH